MKDHRRIREQLLSALYKHQEVEPNSTGLIERQMKTEIGDVDVNFDLYYLLEKGYVRKKSTYYKITAEGIEALEKWDRENLEEMGRA